MKTDTHSSVSGEGIARFWSILRKLETRVIEQQHELLEEVAGIMVEAIANDRRIYLFGTGHSSLPVQEGHLRAGGLAPVIPILLTNLMLHENPMLGSALERTPGLARRLLERYTTRTGDVMFIFSNSGVNQLPVEMALVAKEQGMIVVAVSAFEYARVAPLSSTGKRLHEVANYSIDNGGIPGDAVVSIEGTPWKVSPTSTIINVLLWQCLVSETAVRLQGRVDDFPVYASLNTPGAAEHDERLLKKWRAVNPHL